MRWGTSRKVKRLIEERPFQFVMIAPTPSPINQTKGFLKATPTLPYDEACEQSISD